MVVNIHQRFQQLGFSEYESRVYIALLQQNPATAYDLASRACIPSSKVYGVVDKLIRKEILSSIDGNKKTQYVPMDPEELINRHRSTMESNLSSLEKELTEMKKETGVSVIWNILDYQTLMVKAAEIIESARKTLLISTWKEELKVLFPALRKAEKRKLSIATVHFGPAEQQVGQLYQHPIEETIFSEKGGRGFTIIADSTIALMGTILPDNRVEGAWTKNRGFVTLGEDYIKHDIYMMKIVHRLNETLINRFGESYHLLRDIFSDRDTTHEE